MVIATEDQALAGLRRVSGVSLAFVVDPDAPPDAQAAQAPATLAGAQGALLAATIGALRQALHHLDLGRLGEIIVEGERGSVIAGTLPDGRAAVALADSKANLGMIRMELRRLRKNA